MSKIFWMQPESTVIGTWQKKIESLTGSKTFCVLPWIHLATRPNGDMRLCCSSNASGAGGNHAIGLAKTPAGDIINFTDHTPLDSWNSEYMKSVRRTMLEGEIPESCSRCFKEESKGLGSKRMWESGTWISEGLDVGKLVDETSFDGRVPDSIQYLDLRLGHTCNIKCVMCSPHDSSKWKSDHRKIYPLLQNQTLKRRMKWDASEFNNQWYESPAFWRDLYKQIPNLRQVYFAGGEPLAIKEHKVFLEEIISQGYQDNISLRYNSNGILVNEEFIELWSKFKSVKFGFSIDALSDRNHYIRFPSDWNTILEKLRMLDNSPSNIHVSIATAVQVLNIKTLPEFAKWKITENFKKINLENIVYDVESGGGIIDMHLVYIPTWLSCTILPEKDKAEVREIFAEFKEWLWENYRTDDSFWKTNPYGWQRWQSILDYMDSADNSHELPAFSEYIGHIDSVRKLNFHNVFPEISHLVKT